MQPTILQRFFALPLPIRVWNIAFTLAVIICTLRYAGFDSSHLHSLLMTSLWAVVIIVTGILGWLASFMPGLMVFIPVILWREHANGGPFHVGDYVQVIGGPHDGIVATVIETPSPLPYQDLFYLEYEGSRLHDGFGNLELFKIADGPGPPPDRFAHRWKSSTGERYEAIGPCPDCGFTYRWNGEWCGHCGYDPDE